MRNVVGHHPEALDLELMTAAVLAALVGLLVASTALAAEVLGGILALVVTEVHITLAVQRVLGVLAVAVATVTLRTRAGVEHVCTVQEPAEVKAVLCKTPVLAVQTAQNT